ncbi:serine/threonine protein kinase [Nocardiopsis sp. Huas11]|uniref:serine/threonine protein kinase n=1 Tax=Nocardiopsis sp. Huas11 TaxID=2183912 RepID=UPI000F13336C|nr:serine/threonine-protein kinase [Nocardiopsis sp. Huas11]RKS09436.1 serine/threonine protein kinase [Nocardiopsis sp. Huas11]
MGVGQNAGGFRLVRELRSGGSGTVYLGEDASGGLAAVMLLHPHLAAGPQVRRSFAQELVAARTVRGPFLAAIVDADADPPWIATEYVQGPTLAQAVREHGPRAGRDLQRLAVATITALGAIHAAGVVHHDLTPDHILLGPDGPRVTGFGLSRAVVRDVHARASAARIRGLGYTAPEEFDGTAAGPAADLFAWGAVMIHAATGAEAFPAPTLIAGLHKVLHAPPETGSLTDPLLGIVLACTAKDPDRRPTARQVWDMLLTGSTAPSPPDRIGPVRADPDDDKARLRRVPENGGAPAVHDTNRVEGDVAGQVVQVGAVHGDLTVHTGPPRPETPVCVTVEPAYAVMEYTYDGSTRSPVEKSALFVEATTAQAVILHRLRPFVTRRITDYGEFDPTSVPAALLPGREFVARLGSPKPALYEAGVDTQTLRSGPRRATRGAGFPYYVTEGGPEHFVIRPVRDRTYEPMEAFDGDLVEWHLELDWSCLGRRGTLLVDDEGAPFLCRPETLL